MDALAGLMPNVPGANPGAGVGTPELPGVPEANPGAGVGTPQVPGVPEANPGAGAGTPEVPGVPEANPGAGAGTPGVPGVPEANPGAGAGTPGVPGVPGVGPGAGAGTPGVPGVPGVPGANPGAGGIPGFPGVPGADPGAGGIPGFPGIPGADGAAGGIPGFPAGFPAGGAGAPAFPGSEIGGFPATGFDPNDFDSFGELDFGTMDINMEIPDVASMVAQMESLFTKFEPDLALFESFDTNDIGKLKDSLGGYMKELKIDVSDAVQKAVAEAFAKGEPTEQELIDLGIPADKVKEIKGDKVNSLFGDINFFEDLKPEEIATDIEDKLKDFKKDLEAGLPKGMDTKKFAEIVNKKGCDTQGLKKMLADPAKFNKEYKPPADDKKDDKKDSRRRADNEGIKNYGKTQVKNQAELAGTQQAAATAPVGSGSSLFVSTLTVGFSVAGSYFVF